MRLGIDAAVPSGTRLYVIGDIHGCVDLVRDLHRRILADAAKAPATRRVLVYLGDYIDRGKDSRAVVDLLLHEPLAGFTTIHLKGNHEQTLLDFLDDVDVARNWFQYGGLETLESYGIDTPRQGLDATALTLLQTTLRQALPADHLRFYESLATTYAEGDFLMVHAGLRPGQPLHSQDEADLLWIRGAFLHSGTDFGPVVVHGHTISAAPELYPHRLGIDTGAYYTGRLTCAVLEGTNCTFLQTDPVSAP